jgi:hypothetical protein
MMHIVDVVLDSFSNLSRPLRYPLLEKIHSILLVVADLSLREMKERKKREVLRRVGNHNCSNV